MFYINHQQCVLANISVLGCLLENTSVCSLVNVFLVHDAECWCVLDNVSVCCYLGRMLVFDGSSLYMPVCIGQCWCLEKNVGI